MGDEKAPVVADQVWQLMQAHLGYSDEEIELFRKEPRNARVWSPPMGSMRTMCL